MRASFGEIDGLDEQQRSVTFKNLFYISEKEITRQQFQKFVEETGYRTQTEIGNSNAFANGLAPGNWRRPSPDWQPKLDHPVSFVTFDDAAAFCGWLSKKEARNYRLPTDDEWEYAARAGTISRFWKGDEVTDLAKVANIPGKDDGYPFLAPVGSFPANPWGLYDVHGNAFEWCSIADHSSIVFAAGVNPKGFGILKGGCFY